MFSSMEDNPHEDGPSPTSLVNKLFVEEIDPELLENIKCPKCSKYYFSPIYLCPKGHNLCNYCKEEPVFDPSVFGNVENKINSSASSNLGLFGTANMGSITFGSTNAAVFPQIKNRVPSTGSSLATKLANGMGNSYCGKCNCYFVKNVARRTAAKEKSIRILNFPCGNSSKNCPYRDNLLQVNQHERTCIYAPRSCFYEGCEWKDTTESIINHIKDKHTFIAMNEPQILTEGINIYPVLFDHKFFILKTSYTICGSLRFSVLYPGEGNKYKFDIYLMGYNQDIGIRLTNYCETLLNETVKMNNILSDDITIPFECLNHFITDLEKLRFKISIFKIY